MSAEKEVTKAAEMQADEQTTKAADMRKKSSNGGRRRSLKLSAQDIAGMGSAEQEVEGGDRVLSRNGTVRGMKGRVSSVVRNRSSFTRNPLSEEEEKAAHGADDAGAPPSVPPPIPAHQRGVSRRKMEEESVTAKKELDQVELNRRRRMEESRKEMDEAAEREREKKEDQGESEQRRENVLKRLSHQEEGGEVEETPEKKRSGTFFVTTEEAVETSTMVSAAAPTLNITTKVKRVRKKKAKEEKKEKKKKKIKRNKKTHPPVVASSKSPSRAPSRKHIAVTLSPHPTLRMQTPLTDKYLTAVLDGRLSLATSSFFSYNLATSPLSQLLGGIGDEVRQSQAPVRSEMEAEMESSFHPQAKCTPLAPETQERSTSMSMPMMVPLIVPPSDVSPLSPAASPPAASPPTLSPALSPVASPPPASPPPPMSPRGIQQELELSLEREKTKELMAQLETLKKIQLLKADTARAERAEIEQSEGAARAARREEEAKEQAKEQEKEESAAATHPYSSLDSKMPDAPLPRALKLYVAQPPNPKSREWEKRDQLSRMLPIYTRDTHSELDALKAVNPLIVAPLLKGSPFHLLGRDDERTKCELRVGGNARMLHWSIMNEQGMYRGTLLLCNIIVIQIVDSKVFTLHVASPSKDSSSGGGGGGGEGKTVPTQLTFECMEAATLETWVTGLKFIRDVLPVAGVPHLKRRFV
jgi:hypothetical protein